MVQALQQGVAAEGIDNISVVKEVWAEARVEPADVVLGANVIYGVADIGPFLKKLESQARSRVLILAYMESPPSAAAPLWKMIHGEDRINMPAIPQLMEVLWRDGDLPRSGDVPTPGVEGHGRPGGCARVPPAHGVRGAGH